MKALIPSHMAEFQHVVQSCLFSDDATFMAASYFPPNLQTHGVLLVNFLGQIV